MTKVLQIALIPRAVCGNTSHCNAAEVHIIKLTGLLRLTSLGSRIEEKFTDECDCENEVD